MSSLRENSIISYVGDGRETRRMYRVLCLSTDMKSAFLIEMNVKKGLPIEWSLDELEQGLEDGTYEYVHNDPWLRLLTSSDQFTPKQIEERDKRWEVIKPIVTTQGMSPYIKKERASMIKQRSNETGIAQKALYSHLRKYWQRGKVKNALISDHGKCGARGKKRNHTSKPGRPSKREKRDKKKYGMALNTEQINWILDGIEIYYLNRRGLSLRQAYNKILEMYFSEDDTFENGAYRPKILPVEKRPTYKQFEGLYYQHFDAKKAEIGRKGYSEYLRESRPLLSDVSVSTQGAGAIYEVDATVIDLYLRSSINRGDLSGRATLYFATDRYTRMIVGYYLGFQNPSWSAISVLIANTIMDKTELCRRYGVEITHDEWPTVGAPACFVGDNAEMSTYVSSVLTDVFNIQVSNTAPYRPDQKPIVERMFQKFNHETLKLLPGYVKRNWKRGDPNYKLHARLDIHELHEIIIRYILHHNNTRLVSTDLLTKEMLADGVRPYPIKMWNWCVENYGNKLRKLDDDIVRINLLPKREATVTREGIKVGKRIYYSDYAYRNHWYVHAHKRGKWKVDVHYHPNHTEVIYLITEPGHPPERCTLADKRVNDPYRNADWFEAEHQETENIITTDIERDEAVQSTADFHAHVDAIQKKAKSRARKAEKEEGQRSQRSRTSNVKKHQADEREREIDEYFERFQPASDETNNVEQVDEPQQPSTDVPDDDDEPVRVYRPPSYRAKIRSAKRKS